MRGAYAGGLVTFYVQSAGTFNPNAGSLAAVIAARPRHRFPRPRRPCPLQQRRDRQPDPGRVGHHSGSSIDAFEETQLDVVSGPGVANAAFNTNMVNDGLGGFADLALTSSSNNIFVPAAFALAGSSDVRGTATGSTPAPEPAAAALLGTSLLALAAVRRRRRPRAD